MKKRLIIITLLVVVIICALLAIYWSRGSGKTISQITGVNLNKCNKIILSNNVSLNPNNFKKEFENIKFNKVDISLGSTASDIIKCIDNNNKVLFTMILIGNNGLLIINKGDLDTRDKNNLYQFPNDGDDMDKVDWESL